MTKKGKAETVSKAAEVKDEGPSSSNFQYKSNLKSVVTTIKSIKFTEKQLTRLKEVCPFEPLIDAISTDKLTLEQCRKSDLKLLHIIRKYDKESQTLRIGKDSISITKDHINQIFGISTKGTTKISVLAETKEPKDPFTKKFFKDDKKLVKTVLARALTKALGGKTATDVDDVARLMILLLLNSFFLTTSSMSLGWGYLTLVRDINKIQTYDWGAHIHEKFLSSLKQNLPDKATCCVSVIPYVLMETYNICQPIKGTEKNAILCTKWDLTTFFKLLKKCRNVDMLCVAKNIQNIPSPTPVSSFSPVTQVKVTTPKAKRAIRFSESTPGRVTRSKRALLHTPTGQKEKFVHEDNEDDEDGYSSETLAQLVEKIQLNKKATPCTDIVIFTPRNENENESEDEENIKLAQPYIDDVDVVPESQFSKEIDDAADFSMRQPWPDTFESESQATLDPTQGDDDEEKELESHTDLGKSEVQIVKLVREREETLRKLQEDLEKAEIQLTEMKKNFDERKEADKKRIDILKRNLDERTQTIEDIQQKNEEEMLVLRAEIEDLKKKYDEQVKESERQMGFLKADIDEVNNEREYFKNKLEEKRSDENESIRVSELEKELQSANNELFEVKSFVAKQRSLETEVTRLHSELETERNKIENKERELISHKKSWAIKAQSYKAHIQIEEGKNDELSNELATYKTLYHEAVTAGKNLENENFQLVEENKKMVNEINELTTHTVTQKAGFEEKIADILVDAGVHDVTQADKITKQLEKKQLDRITSAIQRLKDRHDRKPAQPYRPSSPSQPKPTRILRKRKPEPRSKPQPKMLKTQKIAETTPPQSQQSKEFETENLGQDECKTPEKTANEEEKEVVSPILIEGFDENGKMYIIDLSKLDDKVTRPKRPHAMIKKNSAFTKAMPTDLFDEIKRIHNKHGVMVTLMANTKSDLPYCITLDDIYKIVDSMKLCNSTINAHAEYLKGSLYAEETREFKIFDSLIWLYISENEKHNSVRKQNIDLALKQHELKPYKKLIFPMNSNMNREPLSKYTPDHWTLLVLDVEARKWTHYNSNLHRQTKKNDYIEDAELVMAYVNQKISEFREMPPWHWDGLNTQYEFESNTECPQQGDTVDCAMYVCYVMEIVAKNLSVPRSISKEDMFTFKFDMIRTALDEFGKSQSGEA